MSLSQRKAQTHKLLEAETLLKLAIKKMYDQEQVEFNAIHDLVINLITLYEKNRELWKPEKSRIPSIIQTNCINCSWKNLAKKTSNILAAFSKISAQSTNHQK